MKLNHLKRTAASILAALVLSISLAPAAFGAPEGTAKPDISADQETSSAASPSASPKAAEDPAKKKEPDASPSPSPEGNRVDDQGRPVLPDEEAAVLIDAGSGVRLFEKDADKKMFPASTTKIMTGLLTVEALERNELTPEQEIVVTPEMFEPIPLDGTKMDLKDGEMLSIDSLLKGLMIPSGNDAALALAITISGSVDAFVEQMNQRAQELGCENTHFVNPHGLHDEDHYTTAADLAKIAQEAMKHDAFRNVVDIVHIKIHPSNVSKERYYINTNGLLSTMRYREYFYDKATGIKTGATKEAGNCLVSSAKDGIFETIAVVLNGKEIKDSHGDSIRLLDYGFQNFKIIPAVAKHKMLSEVRVKQGAKGVNHVTLSTGSLVNVVVPRDVTDEDLTVEVSAPDAVYAPVQEGDTVAEVLVSYQGQELGRTALLADTTIERHPLGFLMSIWEKLWGMKMFRVIVYLLGAAAAVLVFVIMIGLRREIKRAKQHRRKR